MFFVVCLGSECYCAVGEGYDRDAMPEHAFSSHEEAALAWNTRATFQPSGERREAIARIILTKVLGMKNPERAGVYCVGLANEAADLILASGLVQNEAGIKEKERLEDVAWAAQGLLNADTFVSGVPRAEAVSRATLKLQQALGTWQMHHCAVKAARNGGGC
jgi:hypothetical protein